MTSRISFFKLCLENMKRRVWLLVLTVLTYFISMPLVMMIAIQNEQVSVQNGRVGDYQQIFSMVLGTGYQSILTACLAVICAVAGFAWLFSKKKVDMYHSMPVRREKLFAAIYLNGIVIWLVPYLLCVPICLMMIGGRLQLTGELLSMAAITVAVNFLFFLFFYNLALVAVMLTGNMISCLITEGVLFLYPVALRVLAELYMLEFLLTYYSDFDMLKQMKFTSPIMAFLYFAEEFITWEKDLQMYLTGGEFALYLLQCLILAVIAGVVALVLYQKRSSESAGKSIAFSKILNLYRIVLVIPLSLASGLLFTEIVSGASANVITAWLIFGLLFGLVLSHGFIEVLFQMDIRAMFSYKKQLLATGVVVFLTAFSVKEDWYGFDSYLPEQEEIATMAIMPEEYGNLYYIDYEEDEYWSSNQYVLEHMELTDITASYEMAKRGQSYLAEKKRSRELLDGEPTFSYNIRYRLKNGKEITRSYRMPLENSYSCMEQLYALQEFKDGMMGVFWEHAEKASKLTVSDWRYEDYDLDDSVVQDFLSLYRVECESLTPEELMRGCVVGEISYQILDEEKKIMGRVGDAWLYASCTESIRFLQEHGMEKVDFEETFSPEKVEMLMVRGGDDWEGERVITDAEEIGKLLPYLVKDMRSYLDYKEYDWKYDVRVKWSEDGEMHTFYARVKQGFPIEEVKWEEKEFK